MILLFLVAIFFHCDGEYWKVSVKSEDLDYSTADFWWSKMPKFNATEKMTPPYPFLPTPEGHGKLDYIDRPHVEGHPEQDLKRFLQDHDQVVLPDQDTRGLTEYPEPNITFILPKFSAFPNVTRTSGLLPTEGDTDHYLTKYKQYPGLTLPPNFPPGYEFPTVSPDFFNTTYIPSPTGPTPKGPSFTLPDVQHPIYFYPTGTAPTAVTPWVPQSSLSPPELRLADPDPVTLYVHQWKKKLASDTLLGETPSKLVPVPMLRSVVNYDWKVIK